MNSLDIQITVFEGFSKPIAQISVRDFLKDVKTKDDRSIRSIREHFKRGMKSEADFLKKELRAVTFSATFEKGRKAENLIQYSSLMILDFDDLGSKLQQVKEKVRTCPYTMACFISPKANGLKVLVYTDSTLETHSQVYEELASYYQKITKAKLDMQCKDVGRLCFYSYDPDVYVNEKARTFYSGNFDSQDLFLPSATATTISRTLLPYQQAATAPETSLLLAKQQSATAAHSLLLSKQQAATSANSQESVTNINAFEKAVSLTERKLIYAEGSRNRFVFLLASNCNRYGMPQEDATSLILDNFCDLQDKEIIATVRSAYHSHAHEFGVWQQQSLTQTNELLQEKETRDLQDMPYLPDEAVASLPELLKEPANALTAKSLRERDVFLVGALGILSGCLPGIDGVYDESTVFPNIFTFVVAPASTGKSALKYARELGMKHHTKLLEKNELALQHYKLELESYKEQIKCNNGKSPNLDPPLEPPFELLFIPANTSVSRMIQHIKECNEGGIVCETEADTMANALKADWGGFSDLLRKAFHHEPVSFSRKKDKEFIELKSPRLSIALAGTPDQVTSLIKSAEDGLFSRFGFYIFGTDVEWRNVRPNGRKTNFKNLFERMSFKVLNLLEFCEQHPATIRLSEQQWEQLDATGERWLRETCAAHGNDTSSIIKRHGLILFRLCMLFTALDRFENQDKSGIVYCKDEHFRAALLIVDVLKEHSLEVYHRLPKNPAVNSGSPKSNAFYNLLPAETAFTRQEAQMFAKDIKIPPRTADNYLRKLTADGKLQQFEYGKYIKPL